VLGSYLKDDGTHVGYARTPGYETYKGLGWYGMVVLEPAPSQAAEATGAHTGFGMRATRLAA
jgi:hypothetical protein